MDCGCGRQWQESKVGKVVGTGLGWFNKVAPPPTIASLLGLVVGCVPVLKNLMFPAESAPLGFFTTALNTIANAFVFLISFILGAVLQKGPGPGTRSFGWGAIIMTLLNRWLFLPVLGEYMLKHLFFLVLVGGLCFQACNAQHDHVIAAVTHHARGPRAPICSCTARPGR